MKTAAAVNELGKSSTANEANIVEFMRRVGVSAIRRKLSLANIAGLGATLDDLGQTMEVAGTPVASHHRHVPPTDGLRRRSEDERQRL